MKKKEQMSTMTVDELLDFIYESATSQETRDTPEIKGIFISFYKLKDQNLDRALTGLYQNIRVYQFDNQFKTPAFMWQIMQELNKPQFKNDMARIGTLLHWFGK